MTTTTIKASMSTMLTIKFMDVACGTFTIRTAWMTTYRITEC